MNHDFRAKLGQNSWKLKVHPKKLLLIRRGNYIATLAVEKAAFLQMINLQVNFELSLMVCTQKSSSSQMLMAPSLMSMRSYIGVGCQKIFFSRWEYQEAHNK